MYWNQLQLVELWFLIEKWNNTWWLQGQSRWYWSLNPDKVEVQGSQEEPKKDSDKPVEKEEKSAEVNEKDEAAETKPILKADKEWS